MGNQTSTVIRALKGSTTYYVSVRAYNTAGSGPPSATVNVTTKKPRKYPLTLAPGPGLLQSQVNNVRNVCPCSTESGAHQSDVEHVQLKDHPELGAGQSPGERVRGHRLQSEHPKIVFGIFESMPASIADTDTDTFYLSHDRHD